MTNHNLGSLLILTMINLLQLVAIFRHMSIVLRESQGLLRVEMRCN